MPSRRGLAGKKLGFINEDGEKYLCVFLDNIRRSLSLVMIKKFKIKIKINNFEEDSIFSKKYKNMM
jgi:hypothetical protein